MEVCGVIGCFRGLPRGRFAIARFGEGRRSSAVGAIFTSPNSSSSSSSSILGTISSQPVDSLIHRMLILRVGVFLGDSLDDGEGWEDELMLSLLWVLSGAGPKTTSVAIRKECCSTAERKAGDVGLCPLDDLGQ